jgi:iron complex outermembrane receptor protein
MHLPLAPAPAPRLSRLAVTVSPIAIALLMIGTANAQDSVGTAPASPTVPSGAAPGAASIDATDAIVVTGFRRSVQTSIDIKRQSDIVVDVVTADDIAGLPDVSIAEALARLPGVTSQRTGGQASALNIRGLGQDLVSATLNGREPDPPRPATVSS